MVPAKHPSRKKAIFPGGINTAAAPYSPGLAVGDFVFVSGQIPVKPGTTEILGETIEEQTRATLDNVKAVLEAAGCTMDDCVKVTIHLSDMANFGRMNEVYKTYFREPYPTRTTVQSVLLRHVMVEIDVIAVKGAGGVKG